MLLVFGVVVLVTLALGTIVLVRWERAAANEARAVSNLTKGQVRDVQHRLEAVREDGRRQGEILASIEVVRRLTGDASDISATTGAHDLTLSIPGREALQPARRRESQPERAPRSQVAGRARRRSTAN